MEKLSTKEVIDNALRLNEDWRNRIIRLEREIKEHGENSDHSFNLKRYVRELQEYQQQNLELITKLGGK